MEYLIDTHVCIWAIAEKEKLSENVKALLEDSKVKILVSQVSLFEIALKIKKDNLVSLKIELSAFIESIYSTGFEILPMKNEHYISYTNQTFFDSHKDPFDRLLLSIADYEKLDFITKDEKFELYKDKLNNVW